MKRMSAVFLASLLFLCGCGASETPVAEGPFLYYINSEGNELEGMPYTITGEDAQEAAENMADAISDSSLLPEGGLSVLQNDIRIASCKTKDGLVTIDLSGDYGSLRNSWKLLLTAGLTRSFEQIDGIDQVLLTIQGEALLDSDGRELGILSAEDFVIHSGKEINAYSSTRMTFYFPDESRKLVPETRNVYYSSSVPMEQVVVEEMIKGPLLAEHSAVLPAGTDFNNVTIQEGICYVNFNDKTLTEMGNYDVALALEAIVRSLSANCSIEKVQFSVNGDSSVEIGGVSLEKIFDAY